MSKIRTSLVVGAIALSVIGFSAIGTLKNAFAEGVGCNINSGCTVYSTGRYGVCAATMLQGCYCIDPINYVVEDTYMCTIYS